jgi:hypothetical protein
LSTLYPSKIIEEPQFESVRLRHTLSNCDFLLNFRVETDCNNTMLNGHGVFKVRMLRFPAYFYKICTDVTPRLRRAIRKIWGNGVRLCRTPFPQTLTLTPMLNGPLSLTFFHPVRTISPHLNIWSGCLFPRMGRLNGEAGARPALFRNCELVLSGSAPLSGEKLEDERG